MKEGWQIKKLGCLCSFERGLTYSKGDEAAISTKGVLRSNNVDLSSNTLNFDEIKYLKDDIDIPVSKKVKRNSILMCMSNGSKAHLGKVAIIEDDLDYAFGGFMGLLVPDEDAVFPRYFYYALITPIYKSFIKSLSNGANINNLKFADLKEFEIPVPSISEQQRIVALLDAEFAKIDALKANAEKNLQNAKDLFQAALKKELEPKEGWKRVLMGDVCVLSQGLAINSQTKHLLVEKSELPLLRIKDLRDGTREIFVNEKECPLSCRAYPDDMIYTRTGTLGLIFTGMYGVMHNNCFKIQIDREQIDKFFYMFYVQQASFKNSVLEVAQRAAQPDITHKLFKEQLFSFPSISEQKKIAQILVEVEGKCKILQANYEKTLSLCDDLKQALLRKAFNGEI